MYTKDAKKYAKQRKKISIYYLDCFVQRLDNGVGA